MENTKQILEDALDYAEFLGKMTDPVPKIARYLVSCMDKTSLILAVEVSEICNRLHVFRSTVHKAIQVLNRELGFIEADCITNTGECLLDPETEDIDHGLGLGYGISFEPLFNRYEELRKERDLLEEKQQKTLLGKVLLFRVHEINRNKKRNPSSRITVRKIRYADSASEKIRESLTFLSILKKISYDTCIVATLILDLLEDRESSPIYRMSALQISRKTCFSYNLTRRGIKELEEKGLVVIKRASSRPHSPIVSVDFRPLLWMYEDLKKEEEERRRHWKKRNQIRDQLIVYRKELWRVLKRLAADDKTRAPIEDFLSSFTPRCSRRLSADELLLLKRKAEDLVPPESLQFLREQESFL